MATDSEMTDTVTNTNTNNQTPSHSPSNSQGSSTNPLPPHSPPLPPVKEEKEEENTAMDTDTGVSAPNKPHVHDGFQDFTAEELEKYQKYEAEFASHLRDKYFSNKDIYGGEIFDLKITVGNETIKASRWSPTRSYADPKQSFLDRAKSSGSVSEINPSVLNGTSSTHKKTS